MSELYSISRVLCIDYRPSSARREGNSRKLQMASPRGALAVLLGVLAELLAPMAAANAITCMTTTIAGSYLPKTSMAGRVPIAGSSDGRGTAAAFNGPWGVALDHRTGDLYVTDGTVESQTGTIRVVQSVGGVVTTLAGGGPITQPSVDGQGASLWPAARHSSRRAVAYTLPT